MNYKGFYEWEILSVNGVLLLGGVSCKGSFCLGGRAGLPCFAHTDLQVYWCFGLTGLVKAKTCWNLRSLRAPNGTSTPLSDLMGAKQSSTL